ncbi:MAG: phytoene desaturase family protein [Deltaproteobacteria bacterium]
MKSNHFDTIIVGGGIAGLTSAVYLSRAGKKIVLIEKNEEFGGLVNSFTSDGFHFEAGVRALESAGIILPMLEELNIHIQTVRSKVSVGIEDKILHVEDLNSIQKYKDLLVELYPESIAEVDDFIRSMRKIMKLLDVLYGIENPLFKDLKRDRKYIFKTLLPWLPKFIFTVGKINRLNFPYEAYLENIIKNPSLSDIIGQHFFKGTPAFFALSYFSLYLDYFYPLGGVGKITDALTKKIQEFGGELKPSTMIKEIHASDNLIVDNEGHKYYYQNLIWAADLKTLYNQTVTKGLSSKVSENFNSMKDNILAGRGSESVFTLFLQVDLPLSYFANVSHGHFFYTPSRTGHGSIHRSELMELLQNWDKTDKDQIFSWLYRFLKLNTYEISIPGLKDPSLVPENKTGVIVSFIIEYELFKKVEESGWYNDFRIETENKIIDILSESVYPELKNKIEKQFSFTPISIKNRIGSTDGSIVGWSFEVPVPVVHKIQKSDKSVITPIPNIFQAGQWAYSPAGVPMSILTGKLAANRVIKFKNRV